MANLLERLRAWVDGEENLKVNDVVHKINQAEKLESEQFLKRILHKLDEVLLAEIVRLPNGMTYVPSGFVVYLSDEEERKLRKDKREFFEQGLSKIMLSKAKERAGKSKLNVKAIKVIIRNDGTLESGEIEVRAASLENLMDTLPQNQMWHSTEALPEVVNLKTKKDFGTIEDSDFPFNALYVLEIWQAGKLINEFSIIKREIIIGRDTLNTTAHVLLPSDNQKISRTHARINIEENAEVWVTALGKNPTIVSGHTLLQNEKRKLEKDDEIQIYEFILRLRFS